MEKKPNPLLSTRSILGQLGGGDLHERAKQLTQDRPEMVAKAMANGTVNVVRPDQIPSSRSLEKNFTVRLPDDVVEQIDLRARRGKKPKRLVILEALKEAGFEVRDADLTDDRGMVLKRLSKNWQETK